MLKHINHILNKYLNIPIKINKSKDLNNLSIEYPTFFDDFDEKLTKLIKNKDFVNYINTLSKTKIIHILKHFGHLHGDMADNPNSKFILRIASVLSGKKASEICESEIFVFNHLLIMIILRAIRKLSFINNITKMENPNHFYKFMKSNFYINKVLHFLREIYNYYDKLSKIHLGIEKNT